MQHVFEVIFPYLVVLYVFDCLVFVGRHHVVLSAFAGVRYTVRRGRVQLAGLLPFGRALASHELPLCVTAAGLHYLTADVAAPYSGKHADQWRRIEFERLKELRADGPTVMLPDGGKICFPGHADARRWVQTVEALRRCDPRSRSRKIRSAALRAFRSGRVTRLRRSYTSLLRGVDVLGTLLFLALFVLLPLALYTPLQSGVRLDLLLLLIAAVYLASLMVSGCCLFILQRENRGAWVQQLLSLVFSPVNAVHAGFLLTKDLYGRFAFPALCAAFLPREAFFAQARKEFARIDSCLAGERAADWVEHWQTRKEALIRLLTEVGTSEEEIRKAPYKKDPAARWYCPACLGEYIEGADLCGDCGVQLEKF